VDNGNFRVDLFHRLNVIQNNIPALRERNEDILLLTKYFIEKFSQKLQKNIIKIDDSFYKPLLNYSFPGNVRELENIIERALTLSDSNELNRFHLPEVILKNDSLYKSIDQFKRDSLVKTLHNTKWNISRTSKILGISRPTIYHHIKKWNIKRES
jgi:DNA-binding NtrC family response regulator